MNSKIYRCGWCGLPTDQNGTNLTDEPFKKAIRIFRKYGDCHTEKTHGDCCRNEQGSENDKMVQITRDMAIDAGDRGLEGQWIRW